MRPILTRSSAGHATKSAVTAIGIAAGLTILLLAAIPATLWILRKWGVFRPEIALSVVLIAATASLIIIVAILSVVFSRLKMTNNQAAMGLPEGSIRAIIALLLVLLFFVTAIFLYQSVSNGSSRGPARTLQGITAQRLAALPADEIDQQTERIAGSETVYDVTLAGRPDHSKANDIAAQLVTTVGTLVTAVAAFYFGANTVQAVRRQRRPNQPQGGPQPPPEKQPDPTVLQAELAGGQPEASGP